jgi:hypothetical protein
MLTLNGSSCDARDCLELARADVHAAGRECLAVNVGGDLQALHHGFAARVDCGTARRKMEIVIGDVCKFWIDDL